MGRTYLRVTVAHDTDGSMLPLSVRWRDGRVYTIDKVTDVRHAPALSAGGLGIRYHCWIHGQERYLFFDEGRWFTEKVGAAQQLREGERR